MAKGNTVRRSCGQLVVGGFEGADVPATFARALAAGERGGVIFFSRNLLGDPMHAAELARTVAQRAPADLPPLVSIDQEGGRVQRLKAPVLQLPPMRRFGVHGDVELAERAACALGRQLAALGITMDFAPVLDVNTRKDNPVIGDRAFGEEPGVVARFGEAFVRGLRSGGVLSCGKHFPGHGDTTKDSHFALPVVARMSEGELAPFRAAIQGSRVPALMTAHVIYQDIDPDLPATLSRKVLSRARRELGFSGCLISDDLEMKAVADGFTIEESGVCAIAAGCDALLVCESEELQDRVVDALAKRAAEDATFEARVLEAEARFLAMRRTTPPRPVATRAAFDEASAMARAIEPQLAPLFAVTA